MWSCIDFVFSYSLSVCFHSHSVAAPALSPSSSSPRPTCLRTAVMKSQRKRTIFQGFSLGPGISAKVCCMLQRAAWPLTTARCAQCWHCKGKKRDTPNSGVETFDDWCHQVDKISISLAFLCCQLQLCPLHKNFLGPFSSQQKCEKTFKECQKTFKFPHRTCVLNYGGAGGLIVGHSDYASWLYNRTNESQMPAVECCLTLAFTKACRLMTKDLRGEHRYQRPAFVDLMSYVFSVIYTWY